MKKEVKCGLLTALVVAIIAAAIAVVVVFVLKKKDEGPSERVMYFAMHLGDGGALYENRHEEYKSDKCSLKTNVDNTRSSINAMKSLALKYSLILYTDKIETTAPMTSDEAIQKLDSISPKAHESPFSQEAVLREFASRSGDTLLAYYIPCDFDYAHDKVKKFVDEMKKAGLDEKTLIISNTRTEEEVKKLYEQGNVVGSDTENVAEKIVDFGREPIKPKTSRNPRTTETLETTPIEPKTSSKPGTSVASKTTKTTQKPSEKPSQKPSQKPSEKPTKPTKPTVPPGPTPSPDPNGLHCLFVGDLYNFGSNKENYDKELELFADIGYDFFERSSISRIGLWAYGYTKYAKKPNLNKMSSNFDDFVGDLDNMEYQYISDPLETENAIRIINGLQDDGSMANCLVLFSARQDTQLLPELDPQNKKLKRIVAVGYNNTDLSGVVGSRGVAISVPYYYLDSDVTSVVDAIMGRPVTRTTLRTNPTRGPTTTTKVPSSNAPKCLVVGDLYNFDREAEKYEVEADLIDRIGYDFLLASHGDLELALWAYGYTKSSKTVNDSLNRMHKIYAEFANDLGKMEYIDVPNPLSPESAIKAINEMYDNQKRVNCLVFFSAQ
ncbi:hypothetical protein Aduo_006811 [Ancylostoma duodenale]